ncbi:MAG: hypothetical protein ACI9FB_000722 [Candidatus Azotimanducaceae bacterium]
MSDTHKKGSLPKGRDLLLLTSAAMALPSFAAVQPSNTELSLGVSNYQEGDIKKSSILVGSEDRYDIDIYQFHLFMPIATQWGVQFIAQRELMSGASPWGTIPAVDGSSSLIMTGATISESRTESALTLNRYFDRGQFAVTLSGSDEDDYEALGIAIGGELELNNKQSSISFGASYSTDELAPEEAQLFGRIEQAEKRTRSMSLAWTQVINSNASIQLGVTLTKDQGFLSDPYKLRDIRPDEKFEKSVIVKWRQYIPSAEAAVHSDYRYYTNDFGIDAHTLELSWVQNLGERFQITPSLRYYSQDKAIFFEEIDNYLLPTTAFQSSDHRLAAFGAWSFGLGSQIRGNSWSVKAEVLRYISNDKYGLDESGFNHPASLDFTSFSFGLTFSL